MAMYRIALQTTVPHLDLRHTSDVMVLGMCQALHPITELRVLRLRTYAQAVQRHYPVFWALLAAKQTWKQQIEDDLQWRYDNIWGLTVHPHPIQDMDYWTEMIKHQVGKWKGLLERVTTHALLQQRIRADVQHFHRQALRMLHVADIAPQSMTRQETKIYVQMLHMWHHLPLLHWMGSTLLQEAQENAPGKSPTNRHHSPLVCQDLHNTCQTVCAGTVAAQGWNVEVQPGFGSKANETLEDATALQVWSTSGQDTLQPAQGWAATIHAWRLLDFCRGPQGLTKEEVTKGVYDILRREPISFEEMDAQIFLEKRLQLTTALPQTPTSYRYVLHCVLRGKEERRHPLRIARSTAPGWHYTTSSEHWHRPLDWALRLAKPQATTAVAHLGDAGSYLHGHWWPPMWNVVGGEDEVVRATKARPLRAGDRLLDHIWGFPLLGANPHQGHRHHGTPRIARRKVQLDTSLNLEPSHPTIHRDG